MAARLFAFAAIIALAGCAGERLKLAYDPVMGFGNSTSGCRFIATPGSIDRARAKANSGEPLTEAERATLQLAAAGNCAPWSEPVDYKARLATYSPEETEANCRLVDERIATNEVVPYWRSAYALHAWTDGDCEPPAVSVSSEELAVACRRHTRTWERLGAGKIGPETLTYPRDWALSYLGKLSPAFCASIARGQ